MTSQVSVRLDEPFYEDFMELVEEHDTSKAAVGRELMKDGYQAREEEEIADELREIRERIPRTDGSGVVASKQEVDALREQQSQQQRASAIANAGVGAGIVYLAALTFFTLPGSVVAIFGAVILVVMAYSIYATVSIVSERPDTTATVTPRGEVQ